MDHARKTAPCMNCREQKPIVAHGICVNCYRAKARATARDLHAPAITKEHVKIYRAYLKILSGLSELRVSETDVDAVQAMLQPYLSAIAGRLPGAPAPDQDQDCIIDLAPVERK